MSEISRRKDEHIAIVLERDVGPSGRRNAFDDIAFVHDALPDLQMDAIDLSTEFLGRRLRLPLLISSMTGGPSRATSINRSLAEAAEQCGIALAVGSQRIALEAEGAGGLDRTLRQLAPSVPILANFGIAQLREWDGLEMARRAIDMIAADAVIVHLNPLQEAVQSGGDTDWRGLLATLSALRASLLQPIVVKEIGAGISAVVARRLCEAGISIIDVAGAGGTSWAAVEAERAETAAEREVAMAFRDWGIPTPVALREVRAACPEAVLIASGGVRDGVDVAKAIRLGATVVGQAAKILPAAIAGPEAVVGHIGIVAAQLRIACFCTGSADLVALRQAPLMQR